ncbi:MAG: acyclic terpene utilization AtuA family protein, partial [Pseudomonadota bacterium]
VVIIDFDEGGFTVTPMAEGAACTPHSVSAHMLYENSDPFVLYEPGGHLDVTEADYASLDDTRVRVTGSRWVPNETYTVKLEGSRIAGYQTTLMATLREQRYVDNARAWVDRLTGFLHAEISKRMGLGQEQYQFDFRLIGIDATLGELETRASSPSEVGVLCIITADDAETASEIAKLTNPFLLHYPLTDEEPQATFAFPYSPAESTRGALYEFCLNHVMELDDPMQAFKINCVEVGHGHAR